MKAELTIRPATETDFPSIYRFVNELEEEVFDEDRIRQVYLEHLSNPNNTYLIAEFESKAVGFLSCHSQRLLHHGGEHIAEIREMYVDPVYRSRGVGKQLIDELKQLLSDTSTYQLEVTSNNRREATHRFYIREGFASSHKKFTWRVKS